MPWQLGVVLLLAGATQAAAQGAAPEDNVFIQVNVGGQGGSHTLTQQGTFDIYDDQATFSDAVKVGGGGAVRYRRRRSRVGQQFYAGVWYTHFSDKSDAIVAGSIPHPLRFDLPFRNVSGTRQRPQAFREPVAPRRRLEAAGNDAVRHLGVPGPDDLQREAGRRDGDHRHRSRPAVHRA